MPAYFMLSCYGKLPGTRAQVAIITHVEPSWIAGTRLSDVPEPVECEVVVGGEMVSMFRGGGLLMTERLVKELRQAGVDNLDVYEAVIRDPETGQTWTDYRAVNVVGVVSCADMARSGTSAAPGELIDVAFEGLVIDEKRARGALMFRLAEAVGGIVVHERVKDHLVKAGFSDLAFHDPGAWIG